MHIISHCISINSAVFAGLIVVTYRPTDDHATWFVTIGCIYIQSTLHPSGVARSSTSFGWGKGWNVTSARWQVTLCDPIWHASSRSGVATSVSELLYPCYLLTYCDANTYECIYIYYHYSSNLLRSRCMTSSSLQFLPLFPVFSCSFECHIRYFHHIYIYPQCTRNTAVRRAFVLRTWRASRAEWSRAVGERIARTRRTAATRCRAGGSAAAEAASATSSTAGCSAAPEHYRYCSFAASPPGLSAALSP